MRWLGLEGQAARSEPTGGFGGSRAEREPRARAEAAMRRSREETAAARGGGGGAGGAGFWRGKGKGGRLGGGSMASPASRRSGRCLMKLLRERKERRVVEMAGGAVREHSRVASWEEMMDWADAEGKMADRDSDRKIRPDLKNGSEIWGFGSSEIEGKMTQMTPGVCHDV